MRRLVAVLTGLALAAPAAPAIAQVPDDPEEPAPDPDVAPDAGGRRAEGEYSGVKPGIPQTSPTGRPVKKPRAGTLNWVGVDSGGTRLFLQAGSELGHEQRVEGGALVIHLTGVKRLARNVRRPLDTRYFETAIARVTVKKVTRRKARKGRPARKAGVEVRVTFKKAGDARELPMRAAMEADGLWYLYVDVPAAPAATDKATAPATTPDLE